MYFEYPWILYLTPVAGLLTYTVLKLGRRKFLAKIHRYRHTLVRYVINDAVKIRDRRWPINAIAAVAVSILITSALLMPYVVEKRYLSAFQRVEATMFLKRKIPVVIVLDSSGSMEGDKIYYAVKTAEMFIRSTINYLLIGLIAFNDMVEHAIPPTSDEDLLFRKLYEIKAHGGTIYSKPLRTAYEWLLPYKEFNLTATIIFVTDGLPFPQDIPIYREVVYNCSRNNITIHTVFIETPGVSAEENEAAKDRLAEISSLTGGNTYSVEDARNLIEVFMELKELTIKRAGNYIVTSSINIPLDEKVYIVQPYIFLVFSIMLSYSVLRVLFYKITI